MYLRQIFQKNLTKKLNYVKMTYQVKNNIKSFVSI